MALPLTLFLALLLFSLVPARTHAVKNVTVPGITSIPSGASQVLDKSLASFSIEFSYLTAFGGNDTHPNNLTRQLMERLEERTGVGPDVRPGGITIDSSIFSPDSSTIELDMSSSGGIYRTTFGPALYQSLNVFPNTTNFVLSVNFGNNTIDIARNEFVAGIEYIGWDRIRSLELGNEADHYGGGSRPSGWSSAGYTTEFLNWTATLTQNLSLPEHIFQAGSFAEDPTNGYDFTTVNIIKEGIDTTSVVKLFNQHMYQYSTCDPARNALATLPTLVNHTNITAYVDRFVPQVLAARGQGKEFVVGEYSSVSCSGKENVTDTYGQALWLADTILYSASVNISRMYLHQGATLVLQSGTQANTPGFSWAHCITQYDLWYPIDTDRYGAARASPSFVAYLLVTEAVGSSGATQIAPVAVPEAPDLAVYGIWDAGALKRFAVLNLAHRNVSTTDTDNVAVEVDLSAVIPANTTVKVKRMTAPGMDSKNSSAVTWAGQSYADGTASGDEAIEELDGGRLLVGGSEGVLVFL
ncbi:hypothetical protein OF83DRAFT_651208 [Amylostereum chailletii]|nr:hypothetical protein OF83DRAFT_651208 [Amylostereum chailletii]